MPEIGNTEITSRLIKKSVQQAKTQSQNSSRDEVINGILQGLQEAVAFKRGKTNMARVTVVESKSALEVRQQKHCVNQKS